MHLCSRASFLAISNQREPGEKTQEVPRVRRTVLSKKMPFTAKDVKWKVVLFVRMPVWSYLQIIQMPKSITLRVETSCVQIHIHTFMLRLCLQRSLTMILNSNYGAVSHSPSNSNITALGK